MHLIVGDCLVGWRFEDTDGRAWMRHARADAIDACAIGAHTIRKAQKSVDVQNIPFARVLALFTPDAPLIRHLLFIRRRRRTSLQALGGSSGLGLCTCPPSCWHVSSRVYRSCCDEGH